MNNSLFIVGNRAGSPGPDGAASGYVVTIEEKNILVDCGPGVIATLASKGLLDRIDAVIVTHKHADHSADLPAYAYHQAFPTPQPRIPMYVPTGFGEYVEALDAVHGIPTLKDLKSPIAAQFEITEVEPGSSFEVMGVQVDTVRALHPVPCLSLRFPQAGLVYTSDTAKTNDLVGLATNAKLLLSEATYASSDGMDFSAHGHMSGFEAGDLATEAGAGHLVLTHMEDYRCYEETVANAASRFVGPISVAWVGTRFRLTNN